MGVVTGTFRYANGSPVTMGLYQWQLSQDAAQTASACISPILFTGYLDTSGNMTATFAFNDVLTTTATSLTSYQLTIKNLGGVQVWNQFYTLTGTAAINLNTIPPSL